ncbi:MAG: ankyrin repeat domain-containing protein [Proteobacteria bacterium]|nr:ankyrin repeat domain-containing protein [Pseudomonadota bacterium]
MILAAFLIPGLAFAGVYDDILNAVSRQDVGKVSDLLKRSVDVNTTDQEGNSLLMQAARNGDFPILEILLRNKANVLSINKYGDSALMLAALQGQLRSVEALVAAGAELDPEGWTPLIYAAFEGHTEIVRFLLTQDIDIDAQAENGMTALMAGSRHGHLEIVKILLEHDADVNLVDQRSLTAKDMASKAGNVEVVDELVKAGGR